MTTTVSSFIDTIRESRLLDPGRLEELLRTPDAQAEGVDAPMLGQCLVQLGWLTAFQVEELLKGQVAGLVIGPYRLLERLGEGAFGQAYRARHPDKEGRFVVKLIQPDKLPEAARRPFLDAVHSAGQLAHPNIARVGEMENQDSRPVYVREYVEGIDLASLLARHGSLPVGYACDYIHQAAQGLQHAHDRGLVHGHVQPSNLIVNYSTSLMGAATTDGAASAGLPAVGAVVKLVDFGFGSLYHTEPTTRQQDLAALGRTFAILLSGSLDGPVPADSPQPVKEIVRKLRGESPEDRYESATEAIMALAPLCGTEPAVAEPAAAAMPLLDLSAQTPPVPKQETERAPTPASFVPAEPAPAPALAEPVTPPPMPLASPVPSAPLPPLASPIALSPMSTLTAPEAPPVEEEVERRVPPKPRKKWTTRDWMLVGVGLVLHLFAAVIIIILVMNYLGGQSTNKGKPRMTVPMSTPKGKPKAQRWDGRALSFVYGDRIAPTTG